MKYEILKPLKLFFSDRLRIIFNEKFKNKIISSHLKWHKMPEQFSSHQKAYRANDSILKTSNSSTISSSHNYFSSFPSPYLFEISRTYDNKFSTLSDDIHHLHVHGEPYHHSTKLLVHGESN